MAEQIVDLVDIPFGVRVVDEAHRCRWPVCCNGSRAVAVFQLHLGALVSGEAERDGLNTIDQRDRTYESRVVR